MGEKIILSVDPGREKCGIALLKNDGIVLFHKVIPSVNLLSEVKEFISGYSVDLILMGDGTGSLDCEKALSSITGFENIKRVNEKFTSRLARIRYFKDNPPKGWRRFIPLSLQVPGENYDDYAAIIIAERFLEEKND